jgi:succinoglycan biosynthesis protein ExoA
MGEQTAARTQNWRIASEGRSIPPRAVARADGFGTRSRAHAAVLPNLLSPIGQRSILEHLRRLAGTGITHVDVSLGRRFGGLIHTYSTEAETLPEGLEVASRWEDAPHETAAVHRGIAGLDGSSLADAWSAAVDVVVPAFQEERHIGACLDRVQAQDHSPERVRVFVVDAGSTDRTGDVVRARAARDPRIVLIGGRGRLNAAQAVNAGIVCGSAPFVARVDAHTTLAPDYLSAAARAFASAGPDVACVGGQPEQVGETVFGRGLALARRSPFGVGGSVYADGRARAFVDTVQAGVYRRDALIAVGGFATGMLVGEDEELNWRLRRAGYRILLDTSLRFRYATRPTWRAAFRQYRHYGQSRARVVAAHPDFLRPYHLGPSALVAGAAALAVTAPRSQAARRALVTGAAAYVAASLAAGAHAARSEPRLAPAAAASFSALHMGYGVGLLQGAAQLAAAALGRGAPAPAVRER